MSCGGIVNPEAGFSYLTKDSFLRFLMLCLGFDQALPFGRANARSLLVRFSGLVQGLGFAKQSGLYPRTTLAVKNFFRLFHLVRRLNPSHKMELYFPN
jgi:hypothetical protein